MAERRDNMKRKRLQLGAEAFDTFGAENRNKFWSIVGPDRPPEACWPWPLSVHRVTGKPEFCLIGSSRIDAARFCLTITDRPAVGGEIIRHSCGKNDCVNPAHLSWGTRQKMAKAAVVAGTLPLPETVGEDNGAAILTEEQVLFIRQSEMTGKELAKLFGVSATTISMAQLGETWSHLPGARTRRRVGNPNGGEFIQL